MRQCVSADCIAKQTHRESERTMLVSVQIDNIQSRRQNNPTWVRPLHVQIITVKLSYLVVISDRQLAVSSTVCCQYTGWPN